MNFSSKPNSPIQGRYVIQKMITDSPTERLFLVEDIAQADENLILREFVGHNASQVEQVKDAFQAKFTAFARLKNPQLDTLKDWFCLGSSLFITHHYTEGESYQIIGQTRSSFSESEIVQILQQVLPVLSYLHRENLVHHNLSPKSILRKMHDQLPVLTDFGVLQDLRSQLGIEPNEPSLWAQVKQLPLESLPIGIGEDLYALALSAIILLTGKPLQVLFDADTKTWDWERWKVVSDQLAQLLNQMLAADTSVRFLNADGVLQALHSTSLQLPPLPLNLTTNVTPLPIDTVPTNKTSDSLYTLPPKQPTILVPPLNPTETQSVVSASQSSTDKNWLLALGSGVFLTLTGIIAVILVRSLTTTNQTNTIVNQAINTPFPTSENSVTKPYSAAPATPNISPSPNLEALTEDEAISLLRNWLQAKQRVFAAPYDRSTAASLTTGALYYDITKPGGSIDWLQENNAYYQFRTQEVVPTGEFSTANNQAVIAVKVTEDRTFYVNGRVDSTQTGFKTNTMRYTLQFEDGIWKISDYK